MQAKPIDGAGPGSAQGHQKPVPRTRQIPALCAVVPDVTVKWSDPHRPGT